MAKKTTTEQPAETAPVAIDELVPAVEVYKSVFLENRQRVDRALAAGKAIALMPGQPVLTAEQDAAALVFLQKCNTTLNGEKDGVNGQPPRKGVKTQRLESTRILDRAKEWAMVPENELIAEMSRIKALRDARATHLATEAAAAQKKIDDAKAYENYRNKIKAEMQASYMLKVSQRVNDLYNALKGMFDAATLQTVDKLAGQLNIKPSLKPEAFKEMLTVPYDTNIMSVEQFTELREKAYAYFDFNKVNDGYIKLANDTIQAWRDKIASKKAELENIAKGGEAAERAKAAAAATAAQEAADRQAQNDTTVLEIQQTAAAAEQQDNLQTEFNAQIQGQGIEAGGGKEVKIFRFAPSVEVEPLAFSQALSKVILNVMMNTETSDGKAIIFKKEGNDEHGRRLYVPAIQWWLDQLAKVAYANEKTIPGVVMEKKISTSTRG